MNKLREIRRSKNMRLLDVAVAAGISLTTVHNIENGYDNAKENTKKKLSRALKCDVSEIFPEI